MCHMPRKPEEFKTGSILNLSFLLILSLFPALTAEHYYQHQTRSFLQHIFHHFVTSERGMNRMNAGSLLFGIIIVGGMMLLSNIVYFKMELQSTTASL